MSTVIVSRLTKPLEVHPKLDKLTCPIVLFTTEQLNTPNPNVKLSTYFTSSDSRLDLVLRAISTVPAEYYVWIEEFSDASLPEGSWPNPSKLKILDCNRLFLAIDRRVPILLGTEKAFRILQKGGEAEAVTVHPGPFTLDQFGGGDSETPSDATSWVVLLLLLLIVVVVILLWIVGCS